MEYIIYQNTNTESTPIAEFDDITFARKFISALTSGLSEVNPNDTDPSVLWFEIINKNTISENNPFGDTVYTSDYYYFE